MTGLITYMRTDSIRISDAARDDAASTITGAFGKDLRRDRGVRRKVGVKSRTRMRRSAPRCEPHAGPVGANLSPGQLKVYDLSGVASSRVNEPAKYLKHHGDDRCR